MTTMVPEMRDAFIECLYQRALKDTNIIFFASEYGAPSLDQFRENLPGQFVNTAISEQNSISVAAGMALGGKKVFVYSIASFITLRCYEQLKIDLCCMKQPVTIVGVGATYGYDRDGPTHNATEDIAVMRALANLTIYSPSDFVLAERMVDIALSNKKGPMYIRLDKGKFDHLHTDNKDLLGGFSLINRGKGVCILATGIMVHKAIEVNVLLERHGIRATIIDVYRLKPLAKDLACYLLEHNFIVSLEEHTLNGGLGSLISELMSDLQILKPLKRFGITDQFLYGYGVRKQMHVERGLDVETVSTSIIKEYSQMNTGETIL